MAAPKTEKSTTDGDTESHRGFHEAMNTTKSGIAQEPQNDLASDTVPRRDYDQLLDRLGNLEARVKKIDNSIDWENDDDDVFRGSGEGPWIEDSMLKDILFMIRSAENQRRDWKKRAQQGKIMMGRNKDAKRVADELFIGGQSQNAAQILFGGSKARPNYLAWDSFRKDVDIKAKSFLEPLDVLMEEPDIFPVSGYAKTIDTHQGSGVGNGSRDLKSRYFPERIRIHSWRLVAALKIGAERSVLLWDFNGVIFLRPFKALVHYEPQFRATRQSLWEKISSQVKADPSILSFAESLSPQDEESATIPGKEHVGSASLGVSRESEVVPERNQKHDDSDSRSDDEADCESNSDPSTIIRNSATLLQLDCLLEFFDDNIQPRLDDIASNDDHQSTFDDLWLLFKPGDIVLEQGEKQAYRLIQVTTPEHKATSPWARWVRNNRSSADAENESDGDPFRLDCVFLDFDGIQFGPVSKSFRIPRYNGKKSVKSLPVYSVRFSTTSDIRQQLIARGRVLLDVASPTYRSMYYTGLALDSKEEIDSQVVIDFPEALSIPENESWMPQISPVSTVEKIDPTKRRQPCCEECCIEKWVYNDDDVDKKRTAAFLQTLLPQQTLDRTPLTIHPKSWKDMSKEEYRPNDEEFIIMTCRVFAFVLRSRKWGKSWILCVQNY